MKTSRIAFGGILVLLLAMTVYSANAQMSGYISSDQITGHYLDVNDRSAVVLIHGWTGEDLQNAPVSAFDGSDWPQLVSALQARLNGTGTKLILFHWEDDASTGPIGEWNIPPFFFVATGFANASAAAANAFSNGTRLADQLTQAAPNLRKVVFIAHSAGSWAAYRAIDKLLNANPYVIVELVLLDPFIPGVSPGLVTTFNTATMSGLKTHPSADRIYRLENYFSKDLTDIGSNWGFTIGGDDATSQPFAWRSSRDINGVVRTDTTSSRVDYISILGSYYGEDGIHPGYGHSGPIRFYADTIIAATSGATVPNGLAFAPWSFSDYGFFRGLINEAFLLPSITAQPQAPATPVAVGSTVTLSVSANRTDSFQWFKNGQQYSATGTTLTLNSVSASDAGDYVVRVSNANGLLFSEKAVLQVDSTPAPTISSVTPRTLNALPLPQTRLITITGTGFTSGSRLTFNPPQTDRVPSSWTATQLTYNLAVGPVAATWTVKVVNGGVESLPYTFYVVSGGAQLTGLSISGPATVNENGIASFTAKAIFSDGSSPTVNATWSVISGPASINSSSGQLTAGSVTANTIATISATYITGGVTKTATVAVTIVNAGGGGTQTTNLIVNGGFENGTTGWSATTVGGGAIPSAGIGALSYPHSGSWYGYLGNVDNALGTIHQFITIPANAQSVTLSFYLNVVTAEITTGNPPFDVIDVSLRTTADTLIRRVASYSEADKGANNNGAYVLKTMDLTPYIGAYKGGQVILEFYVDTDGLKSTIFRIDDVSVQAVVPLPVTLTSLVMAGPSSVTEGNTAQYFATAVFSDGSTNLVTPNAWGENSSATTISSGGLLTAGQVSADTSVSLYASYTYNSVTREVYKDVTVVNQAATFSYLAISGPSSINENSSGQFTATAIFSDGSWQSVSPNWSENSTATSIAGSGLLTAGEVSSDTTVTVSASHTIGEVMRNANQDVLIVNIPTPPTLVSLSISGPSSVNENDTAQYTAMALFSDGSSQGVDPAWGEDSSATSISIFGLLSSGEVASDTPMTVSASYSFGGVTRNASKSVTVVNGTITPPTISVTPASLPFSAVAGGGGPLSQTVSVSNSGGGTLNWSAAVTSGSFLTLAGATSGINSGSFQVFADVGALSADTYNGNIRISASGAANTPRDIPVTFTVSPPQTGSLQVSLAPAGAVSAGAQWQVDGGAWQNSGATVSGLSVGSHTVAFNTVSGWTTPGNQNVTVNANVTTPATGTYVTMLEPPKQLTEMALSNGVFRFVLNGPVRSNYVIQVSSNLVNWLPLVTNVIPASGSVPITDPVIGSATRFYRAVGGNTSAAPTNMALIPAGSFQMGDSLDGDSSALPLHTVYVSAFYMDQYEVTKALWDEVYNWAITHGYSFDNGGSGKAATHPVQTVTWYDAVKWCNARSEKEGRTPAYFTDAGLSVQYRTGKVAPYANWNTGYRLPTEAEWEKAARGGASGQRFPWGDTITHSQANYYSDSSYSYDVSTTRGYHPSYQVGGYTSPVGSFAPNAYGLYDMAGNVWGWCWDWYGSYSSAQQSDPRGPASGSDRVIRGGGWLDFARGCRVSNRDYGFWPGGWSDYFGFRSALPAGQ